MLWFRIFVFTLALSLSALADEEVNDENTETAVNIICIFIQDTAYNIYQGVRHGVACFGMLLILTIPYELLSGNYITTATNCESIHELLFSNIINESIAQYVVLPIEENLWSRIPHINIDNIFAVDGLYNLLHYFGLVGRDHDVEHPYLVPIPLSMMFGFANFITPNPIWYRIACNICTSPSVLRCDRGLAFGISARITTSLLFWLQRYLFLRFYRGHL